MSQDDVTQSRYVRGVILDLLWAADSRSGAFGLSFEQFRGGFGRMKAGATPGELRRELRDLVGDGLVEETWDEQLADNFYAITSRGRDFKRAGCPWDKVDEFTGGQPL